MADNTTKPLYPPVDITCGHIDPVTKRPCSTPVPVDQWQDAKCKKKEHPIAEALRPYYEESKKAVDVAEDNHGQVVKGANAPVYRTPRQARDLINKKAAEKKP
jgi:hypothetical protein